MNVGELSKKLKEIDRNGKLKEFQKLFDEEVTKEINKEIVKQVTETK